MRRHPPDAARPALAPVTITSFPARDLEVALAAAEAAAELIRGSGGEIETVYKARNDIVTNVDRAAERVILNYLLGAFPDDAVVSEEAGALEGGSGRTWYIDPLDGTANFAAGVPHFAVALALDAGEGPVLAVTVDVARGEVFTATRGATTTRSGSAVAPGPVDHLEDALLALQLPEPIWRADARLERAVNSARGVRVTGSMALDFAWTAAGLFDACLYRQKPSLWDWFGGEFLVTQAGGAVAPLGTIGEYPLMVAGRAGVVGALAALAPWQAG